MRVLKLAVCILVGVIGIAPASARAGTITMFGIDNGAPGGWSVLFDLTVPGPGGLLITDLDVNINSVTPVGTAFSLDIYTRSGTAVGFAENGGIGWTLATSGTGVSAAEGSPSPVNLLDFLVAPGVTGIAIDYNNAAPAVLYRQFYIWQCRPVTDGLRCDGKSIRAVHRGHLRPTHLERHDYVSDGHGASPRTRIADPARPRSASPAWPDAAGASARRRKGSSVGVSMRAAFARPFVCTLASKLMRAVCRHSDPRR